MSLLYLEGRRTTPLSQVQATSIYQFFIGFLVLVVGSLSIVAVKFYIEKECMTAELRGHDSSDTRNGEFINKLLKTNSELVNQLKVKRMAFLPFPGEVK